MLKARFLPFALIILSACAQPLEERVAARLRAAGVSQPMAECMAGLWVDRLSIPQLQKIEQFSTALAEKSENKQLSVLDLVAEVERMDDPEIVRVVTASAAGCALRF